MVTFMDNPSIWAEANTRRQFIRRSAGALAGALTVILVWAIGFAGVTVPPAVASAFTVLLTFGVSWLVTERRA
jgi:hypothetical protein